MTPQQRDSYVLKANQQKQAYAESVAEFEKKHGRDLEGQRRSIVSFLTHGAEFNKAAVW